MSRYLLQPDWPAPAQVRAVSTLRRGGVSQGPWQGLNLALHVQDDPEAVRANRAWLRRQAVLPNEPCWLEQVHGIALCTDGAPKRIADGCFSRLPGKVCAVLTADCLPLLLCNCQGTAVAAVHAGWRGLLNGVIEAAVDCFEQPGEALLAWLGPAIGPTAFEVGDEVRQAFVARQAAARQAFVPSQDADRWLADIYQLARLRLHEKGVRAIYGGGFCTYTQAEEFFSYRRDGLTGRMATLIWLEENE